VLREECGWRRFAVIGSPSHRGSPPKLSVVGEEAGQAGVGGRIDFKNVTFSGKEHLVYTNKIDLVFR
jgi:hypothetical protein